MTTLNQDLSNQDLLLHFNKNIDKDLFIKRVKIGHYIVCQVLNEYKDIIEKCSSNIFIETNYKDFLWLKNKKSMKIEYNHKIYEIYICKIISYEDLLQTISLENKSFMVNDINKIDEIETIDVIYGRCNESMVFLDKVYRDYIYHHKFKKNSILAIKSVAGSGKTTTLIELTKKHFDKKILYIAFNKSLIEEMKDKLFRLRIKNMFPTTFDALSRSIFKSYFDKYNSTTISQNNSYHQQDKDEDEDNDYEEGYEDGYEDCNDYVADNSTSFQIVDLKPQNLHLFVEFFHDKQYKLKDYYIKNFNKFCNQTKYKCIKEFSIHVLGTEKKLLTMMWEKVLKHKLITFNSIRKLVEINRLSKDFIDKNYDMIFIDESQDFDNVMLKILLEDTTIPKVFVGDTRQAIYEWKGSINAFDKLPKDKTLTLEFYSTFRVGNPACNEISKKFTNCWMISKSIHETILETDCYKLDETTKYVYLFRNWKNLLKSAQHIKNIWIYNYNVQIEYIKKLHARIQNSKCKLTEDEMNEFSDDLPKFLVKMSFEDLDNLINNITNNIVQKEDCMVEFYTIHSYKGLENNIIRIYNDIDISKETNLYYVALTRGFQKIILDKNNHQDKSFDNYSQNNYQNNFDNYSQNNYQNNTKKKNYKNFFKNYSL